MNKEKIQNNIEEKILDKISTEHIEPKPRWEFLLKNVYIWTLGTVTIVLGALSVSATIFVLRNIKWELRGATHDTFSAFLFDFVPYLWSLLFILFLTSAYFLVRKTKKGYRYHMTIILFVVLGSSMSLGSIFYIIGFGELIDGGFDNKIPLHQGIRMQNRMLFDNPEQGLLFGKVFVENEKSFITNFKGENMELITAHLGTTTLNTLYSESSVRVIGLIKDDKFFVCGAFLDLRQKGKKGHSILERKFILERNKECEDVRPYQRLLQN